MFPREFVINIKDKNRIYLFDSPNRYYFLFLNECSRVEKNKCLSLATKLIFLICTQFLFIQENGEKKKYNKNFIPIVQQTCSIHVVTYR